jgi:hypothetical protein
MAAAVMSPTPAHADDIPPRVLSAQRLSAPVVTGGATITVSADAADGGGQGAGVHYVTFTYETYDEQGAEIGTANIGAYESDGANERTGHTTLSPWAAPGNYLLEKIAVMDYVGNYAIYARDGTGHSQTGEAVPSLDFAPSSLDFAVENTHPDTAVPVVTDLQTVHTTIVAGTPLLITSHASDDVSGVRTVTVQYTGPTGQHVDATTDDGYADAGLMYAAMPLGADGGEWQATTVVVFDRAGNGVIFTRNYPTTYSPAGVRSFADQPPIDWSKLDVQVTPVAPDHDAPVISDISRVDTGDVHPGDDVAFRYSLTDASDIDSFSMALQDSGGHQYQLDAQCEPKRGFVVDALPQGFDLGAVQVMSISAGDSAGNHRQIMRDGSSLTNDSTNGATGPPLASLDFTVVAGPPSTTHATPTRIACPRVPLLPVAVPAYVPIGTSAPLLGHVQQPDQQAVPDADVAVYAQTAAGSPRLLTLARTDVDGAYSTTVPAVTGETKVRVKYFGGDQLQPLLSPAHTIAAVRPQRVSGYPATPVVTFPALAVIKGAIAPARPKVQLELQVPTASGWRTAQVAYTDSLGKVRFIQPVTRGIRRYRVYVRVVSGWAAAVSAVFAVTVK